MKLDKAFRLVTAMRMQWPINTSSMFIIPQGTSSVSINIFAKLKAGAHNLLELRNRVTISVEHWSVTVQFNSARTDDHKLNKCIMLVSSPKPTRIVSVVPDIEGNLCYKLLLCPDALRRAKTPKCGHEKISGPWYVQLHYELYITRKVSTRRFRNYKRYYVKHTLSCDISEILLKVSICT